MEGGTPGHKGRKRLGELQGARARGLLQLMRGPGLGTGGVQPQVPALPGCESSSVDREGLTTQTGLLAHRLW